MDRPINLTVNAPTEPTMPLPPTDHMHPVVDLIRYQSVSFTAQGIPRASKVRKNKISDAQSGRQGVMVRKPREIGGTLDSPLDIDIFAISESSPSISSQLSTPPFHVEMRKKKKKQSENEKAPKPFPLMRLPAEIRNSIYRLLLTTPNKPIELPRLERDAVFRAAKWTRCKSERRKKQFKSIFLEILETCKQIHDEATGILYGCNVFKYRCCYKEGPKDILLPTRHLHLLKHIKLSVISREQSIGQEDWVARLVNSFRKDEIQLDTFEMSWFGWTRFYLRKGGTLSQALRSLHVSKSIIVHVTGEARMKRDMMLELEENMKAITVEIHRPVKEVVDGQSIELSDDEIENH